MYIQINRQFKNRAQVTKRLVVIWLWFCWLFVVVFMMRVDIEPTRFTRSFNAIAGNYLAE